MIGAVVAIALVVALVVYGLVAWERIVKRHREQDPATAGGSMARAHAARPAATPDAPRSFARGDWLAVRTNDTERVVAALGLRTVLPANWRAGLAEAATAGVFVTPPVRGFVFATGADLGAALGPHVHTLPALLERLAATFPELAWFRADAANDRHGWALVRRGAVERVYAYDGDDGHVAWHGEPTEAERELGCFVDDPRDLSDDEVKWWPDAALVAEVAAAWSLDPRSIDRLAIAPSAGWLGRL
ncbi:MAG: hypothetical protein JNK78_09095 [Planctomycetes bacterium]|nr:hypothetical protein [Planctomycetota bacterium]